MKISREVRTAILALTAITLLIFGYNYLKGENLLQKNRVFYAVYDNVEGLAPGANVTINGLGVGKIQEIKFADKSGKLVVQFNVDSDFEFSNKSVVQIYGTGFISGKNLSLIPDFEGSVAAKNGDTLISSIESGIMDMVNERLVPLQSSVEAAITNTDSLVGALNNVLTDNTQENLRQSIANFSLISNDLKKLTTKTNSLLADNEVKLTNTLGNLEKAASDFSTISSKFTEVDIQSLVTNMDKVMTDFEQITTNLKDGKGTVGKLLLDEQVYVNLERTSKQMELLLQDMRLNPKRYVHFSLFGKKAKEYEQPNDSLR